MNIIIVTGTFILNFLYIKILAELGIFIFLNKFKFISKFLIKTGCLKTESRKCYFFIAFSFAVIFLSNLIYSFVSVVGLIPLGRIYPTSM